MSFVGPGFRSGRPLLGASLPSILLTGITCFSWRHIYVGTPVDVSGYPVNLSAFGSPQANQPTTGLMSNRISETALEFAAGAHAWQSDGSHFDQDGTHYFLVAALFKHMTGVQAGSAALMGKRSGNDGWRLVLRGATNDMAFEAGTALATAGTVFLNQEWHCVAARYTVSNTIQIGTEGTQTAAVALTGNVSNSNPFAIGQVDTMDAAPVQVAWAGLAQGEGVRFVNLQTDVCRPIVKAMVEWARFPGRTF